MRKLLFILLLCPLFFTSCYAENTVEQAAALTDIYAVEDDLDESESAVTGSLSLDGSYDVEGALSRLWRYCLETMKKQLREEFRFCSQLTAIGVFCSMTTAFCEKNGIEKHIHLAGCCAVAVVLLSGADTLIGETLAVLTRLSDYSKAALPSIFTAAAAGGALLSSSAEYAAVSLSMDLQLSLSQWLVVPLIEAFLAVSVTRSLFDNAMLRMIGSFLKWASTTLMTGMTLLFTAYISMTGLLANSGNAIAVKATRTLLSSALPVVGGILSDSASTVLAAATFIKNTAGVFSLIAVCVLCAAPFAMLFVKMLAYKATAAVVELMDCGPASGLIGSVGTAMGMLMGLVGSSGIMLFLSVMAGIKVVAA